ncbi:MAG: endonuclease [Bacteroidia bacterium]|nr:endonuclease [Bacteroidia bacterium]
MPGQAILTSPAQLNFGTATEIHPDSILLTLTNSLNRDVTVTGMKCYNTYGTPAFSPAYSYFTIPANGSADVWIRFLPLHNIFHNSELVIENDGLRGYTRVDLTGQGHYSMSYYDTTENLSEEDLKAAIHNLTGFPYFSLGYGTARDSMFMSIDNQMRNGQGASQNTIESIYTGALAVGYTDRVDCQNTFDFNTEHTFPQSFFSQLEPMKSDLHHLFPTDEVSNTKRGDNPFGVVTNPTWTGGGSKADGFTFEPRDLQKGATARAMFYFVLRYQNYNNFLNSQEAILRTWHEAFPPGVVEKRRNDDIAAVQFNRNPFVDYPQLLDRIHSVSSFSSEPPNASIDITEDTILFGTVAPANTVRFEYVLVNNGNRDFHVSQLSLTPQGILSFANGTGADTVIAPGEALSVLIDCSPLTTDSVRGWLHFETDVPGALSENIPVFVNDLVFTGLQAVFTQKILAFPNPSTGMFHAQWTGPMDHPVQCVILSMDGRRVFSNTLAPSGNRIAINASSLTPGAYLLQLSDGNSAPVSEMVFIQ